MSHDHHDLFIDGRLTPAQSEAVLTTINPATQAAGRRGRNHRPVERAPGNVAVKLGAALAAGARRLSSPPRKPRLTLTS